MYTINELLSYFKVLKNLFRINCYCNMPFVYLIQNDIGKTIALLMMYRKFKFNICLLERVDY